MGRRISFHQSGSHFQADVGDSGYTSQWDRVRFVKGWLTGETDPEDGSVECGPGTPRPVVATLNQSWEIYYRARNTKITAYEVYQEHATSPSTNTKWWALFNAGSVPANNYWPNEFLPGWSPFGSRGMYFSSPSNPGWLAAHCGPEYSAGGTDYHDAGDELCLWPPADVSAPGNGMSHSAGHGLPGASDPSPPSSYGAYNKRELPPSLGSEITYRVGQVIFSFTPTIAFVGGDSPFSPGVTLYPSINFLDTFSNHTSNYGSASSAGNAEVVLASGTLLVPIYLEPLAGYTATLITPPRLEVTEWWPYATTAGDDAWDTATGDPDNGGPAA
jgi:hypothetical protein